MTMYPRTARPIRKITVLTGDMRLHPATYLSVTVTRGTVAPESF